MVGAKFITIKRQEQNLFKNILETNHSILILTKKIWITNSMYLDIQNGTDIREDSKSLE